MSPKPPRRPPAKGPRKGKPFRDDPEGRPGRHGGDSRAETPGHRSGSSFSPRNSRKLPRENKGLRPAEAAARTAPAQRGEPRPSGRERGEGPRPRSGEGWIYGHHAVAAALANPARRIERLVLTRDAEETLGGAGIPLRMAPEIRSSAEISALLPDGATHQGFALRAAPLPAVAIADVLGRLKEGAPALVVVLDQVTDPRNVGAILRSAAAFGAAAVILPERHGADTTAAMAKTASGALETVALVRVTNISRTLEALKAGGFWCVGLDAQAPEVLSAIDLTGRVALVLGSEGSGLRRLVRDTCDLHARLPIGEGMESLNVSAAAAIAMYEVARRRA